MRKSELVALLQNNPPPAPQMSTWDSRGSRGLRAQWKPIHDRRPRKPQRSVERDASANVPSPQEMDIFEQQEMSKSRPQVKSKLNKWYDWLMNHVPKPIKDGASKAFKTSLIRLWGCIIGLLVPLLIRPN